MDASTTTAVRGEHRAHSGGNTGGAAGLWFLGFIGALVYFLQVQSPSVGSVLLAILKAIVWPALLVYHGLLFLHA